jgi:Protein of unknown function (DUF4256)
MSVSKLNQQQSIELILILQTRFEKNIHRHKDLQWTTVETKLKSKPEKLWALAQMENTGGEPEAVFFGDFYLNGDNSKQG